VGLCRENAVSTGEVAPRLLPVPYTPNERTVEHEAPMAAAGKKSDSERRKSKAAKAQKRSRRQASKLSVAHILPQRLHKAILGEEVKGKKSRNRRTFLDFIQQLDFVKTSQEPTERSKEGTGLDPRWIRRYYGELILLFLLISKD